MTITDKAILFLEQNGPTSSLELANKFSIRQEIINFLLGRCDKARSIQWNGMTVWIRTLDHDSQLSGMIRQTEDQSRTIDMAG